MNSQLAVSMEEAVPARMRDGVILRADVYRPTSGGPFPTVLLRQPFGSRRPDLMENCRSIASHGYIVVVQDVRGRYMSDGKFYPWQWRERIEDLDGYDTVQWATALPGSNGLLGTFGVGYGTWTQYEIVRSGAPQLKAMFTGGMAPSAQARDPYGIFRTGRTLRFIMWLMVPEANRRLGRKGVPVTDAQAIETWNRMERDKWCWFLPLASIPDHELGDLGEWYRFMLSTIHEDKLDLEPVFRQIKIPVLHLTGWYDRMSRHIDSLLAIRQNENERTRISQRLVIGPWPHGFVLPRKVGEVDFGEAAVLNYGDMLVSWFDRWLKGIRNGVDEEPLIKLFVMGRNQWRDENAWPLARTHYVNYYLHSGGEAKTVYGDGRLTPEGPGDETPDTYDYDPRDPVMSIFFPDCRDAPFNQAANNGRRDLLVFQTPPLEEGIEVTGELDITLWASSSAPDTDFVARLNDVHPNGFVQSLSYGVIRACYRNGTAKSELLEPGRPYEFKFRLLPTSNYFAPGHRIRLDITSSDFPNFDRNHNVGRNDYFDAELATAHQVIFHDKEHPSHIVLPIIEN